MLCAERPAPVLKDINRERACDSECVCVRGLCLVYTERFSHSVDN